MVKHRIAYLLFLNRYIAYICIRAITLVRLFELPKSREPVGVLRCALRYLKRICAACEISMRNLSRHFTMAI